MTQHALPADPPGSPRPVHRAVTTLIIRGIRSLPDPDHLPCLGNEPPRSSVSMKGWDLCHGILACYVIDLFG